ncbi:MAG: ABC transporter ATP-binding protein, partial [Desulfurococcales archaeon]|nr:ABC transporter ATP-binding protein [Desulfurococcales archaeon]
MRRHFIISFQERIRDKAWVVSLVAVMFNKVVKTYGSTQALMGVTFSVPKGCIAGLVGPNGAGKTTTLKIAQGVLRRDYGDVKVLGYDPWDEGDSVRRLVGFLPEAPQFPSAPVWRLLTHVAELKSPGEAEREVRRVVRLTGIKDIIRRSARKLSGGFRQRVALALALIGEPRLLLLDEPASNLDPNARTQLYDLLQTLRRDYGIDIVVSTHILAEARDIVDYLDVISKGLVVAEGWTSELLRKAKITVRASFKLGREVDAKALVGEVVNMFRIKGVSLEGDFLTVEADAETMEGIKEFLEG